MPPILDRVTEQCPPQDVPSKDEPPKEEESFGGTIKRYIMDFLPEDVVEGGKTAVDVMGRMGTVDFGTALDNLKWSWRGSNAEEVGARLRQSYEERRRGFTEHKEDARATREEEPEKRRTSTVGFNADRTAQGLTAMSDLAIEGLQQDILDWRESPVRQQYLDAITAERQRRDE